MPTKLLVWNIQNFTINKIDFSKGETIRLPSPPGILHVTSTTTLKNKYILDNIASVDPDIFIVIEVISGRGAKGSLVTGKGAMGVHTLLQRMKTLNNNWFLVPPLKLTNQVQVGEIDYDGEGPDPDLQELLSDGGYTEAIAVFFRKDKVNFIGPNIWPTVPGNNNTDKTSVPPGPGVVAGAYPDAWQNCLPANPDGSLNYFAGRADFRDTMGNELFFPAATSRRPFLTKFQELHGASRILTISAVHFPPKADSAAEAFAKLVEYFNGIYGIAQNEIIIIAGDYNINCFQDTGSVFRYLSAHGFPTLFGNTSLPTMYKRIGYATPTDYSPQKGLDNFSLKLGSPGLVGNGTALILDRVEGNRAFAPPLSSLLLTPYNTIIAQPTPAEQNELFRKPFNYGKMGPAPGTSDHKAIYLEL